MTETAAAPLPSLIAAPSPNGALRQLDADAVADETQDDVPLVTMPMPVLLVLFAACGVLNTAMCRLIKGEPVTVSSIAADMIVAGLADEDEDESTEALPVMSDISIEFAEAMLACAETVQPYLDSLGDAEA